LVNREKKQIREKNYNYNGNTEPTLSPDERKQSKREEKRVPALHLLELIHTHKYRSNNVTVIYK
jgi:hypothetical protein